MSCSSFPFPLLSLLFSFIRRLVGYLRYWGADSFQEGLLGRMIVVYRGVLREKEDTIIWVIGLIYILLRGHVSQEAIKATHFLSPFFYDRNTET